MKLQPLPRYRTAKLLPIGQVRCLLALAFLQIPFAAGKDAANGATPVAHFPARDLKTEERRQQETQGAPGEPIHPPRHQRPLVRRSGDASEGRQMSIAARKPDATAAASSPLSGRHSESASLVAIRMTRSNHSGRHQEDARHQGGSKAIKLHERAAEPDPPDGEPVGKSSEFFCKVGQWPTADVEGLKGDARYRCTEEGAQNVTTDEGVERRIPVGGHCWVQCNTGGGLQPAVETVKCIEEASGTIPRFEVEPRCVQPNKLLERAAIGGLGLALLGYCVRCCCCGQSAEKKDGEKRASQSSAVDDEKAEEEEYEDQEEEDDEAGN